jgi:hypothetical protein
LKIIQKYIGVLLLGFLFSATSTPTSSAEYSVQDLIREIPEFEAILVGLKANLPKAEKDFEQLKETALLQWGTYDPTEIYNILAADEVPGVPKSWVTYKSRFNRLIDDITWYKNSISNYEVEIPRMKALLQQLLTPTPTPIPVPTPTPIIVPIPTPNPTPTVTPSPTPEFKFDYVESHQNLKSEISALIKKYPSQKKNLTLYLQKLEKLDPTNESNSTSIEKNLIAIRSKIEVIETIVDQNAKTLNCVNGKKTLKVRDLNPKCPSGYKKR